MREFLGTNRNPWSLHKEDINYLIRYLQYMIFTKLISELKYYEKMFQESQQALEEIYNRLKIE